MCGHVQCYTSLLVVHSSVARCRGYGVPVDPVRFSVPIDVTCSVTIHHRAIRASRSPGHACAVRTRSHAIIEHCIRGGALERAGSNKEHHRQIIIGQDIQSLTCLRNLSKFSAVNNTWEPCTGYSGMHNMLALSTVTHSCTLRTLRPAIGRPQHAQRSKRGRSQMPYLLVLYIITTAYDVVIIIYMQTVLVLE